MPDAPELADDLEERDVAGLSRGDEVEDALVTGELLSESLAHLTFAGCRFEGVRLTGSTFDDAELEDVVFVDSELAGVTLTGARLQRVRFERCRLSGLSAAEATGDHLAFDDCRLDDAWFRMGTLDRVEFADCDLRRADFYATGLRRSAFLRCDLTGAELSKADVSELRLERTTVVDALGLGDLRDVVLSQDMVVPFALEFLAAHGITVDDGAS